MKVSYQTLTGERPCSRRYISVLAFCTRRHGFNSRRGPLNGVVRSPLYQKKCVGRVLRNSPVRLGR